jgi:hypothetical protein
VPGGKNITAKKWAPDSKNKYRTECSWRGGRGDCIFFLTLDRNNLIYESHCDLYGRKFDVRENQSMKNAAKKPAKKAAKKAAPKKKK